MAFKNAHQDMDGCTCLERNKKKEVRRQWDSGMLTGTWMDAPVQKKNKKMQVRRPWHSEMLTGTWMDAPGRKEIKKCRSVGDSIQECSPGHGWMHLPGKKSKKGGPSAMGFGNVHWDMGGCTCPEKNKK